MHHSKSKTIRSTVEPLNLKGVSEFVNGERKE